MVFGALAVVGSQDAEGKGLVTTGFFDRTRCRTGLVLDQ
jgi:hypothetical protein